MERLNSDIFVAKTFERSNFRLGTSSTELLLREESNNRTLFIVRRQKYALRRFRGLAAYNAWLFSAYFTKNVLLRSQNKLKCNSSERRPRSPNIFAFDLGPGGPQITGDMGLGGM